MLQRTLRRSVRVEGIGLHSGHPASVTLKPALPNEGIHFVRTDLADCPRIAAHTRNITDTRMATTIGQGKTQISTIEHLMAAVAGSDIDNLLIEVDGPEIPIMDGSSIAFFQAIQNVGTESQLQPRSFLQVLRRVEVMAGEKWAFVEPASELQIHATIEWDHPAIGYQELRYVQGKNDFSEIASARTFGFLRDVEALWSMGLAKGGSLENAIVVDDARVLNPEGLRYKDEFIRHKVLDAIGDLHMSGYRMIGNFRLHRAGHDVHRMLVAEILKDPANYQVIIAPADTTEPRKIVRLRTAVARSRRVAVTY